MGLKKFFVGNKLELFVLLTISILMLSNFSNMYLWNDEGETAVLAKNTMLFGIPKVYDGKNFITNYGNDYNSGLIWTWSSWLHIYLAALSFLIFGFSTFSARVFFVVIGILSFFPITALFRKISINKAHYYLSVLSLLFFVPYYLYSRQSRYYALLIFLMPVILISTYNIIFKNGSILWFVISFTLLFYSNYLSFFVLIVSASLYFCLMLLKNTPDRKKLLKKLITSYVIIFLLTFPWAVYVSIFERISTKINPADWAMRKIDYVLHSINSTAPLLLLLLSSIFILLFFYSNKGKAVNKQKTFFIFFNGIIPIIILFFPKYSDVRYIIGLFPLWISFILLPVIFLLTSKRRTLKMAGAAILFLFLFTNIFYSAGFYPFSPFENYLKEKCSSLAPKNANYCNSWVEDNFISQKELKFPFFYYLYEITHDYDGPVEGIVKFLKSNGNEYSIVFANNEYFSLQFYTNMKVLNTVQYQATNLTPDFIFVNLPDRRDIPKINYLITYAEKNKYTKIALPYPDLQWDNRPVVWYHKFWTQPIKIPVTIYKKENIKIKK